LVCLSPQEKKEKLCKQEKRSSHELRERATWEEKPPHQKRRKQSVGIRRVAGRQLEASRPLLISLKVTRTLKRTSVQAY